VLFRQLRIRDSKKTRFGGIFRSSIAKTENGWEGTG